MFKKILSLTVLVIVFVFGISLLLPQNNNYSETANFKENQTKESASEKTYVEVSNAEEFIQAAQNNQNIRLINDIDFSNIDESVQIQNYSKTIDGQYYHVSNRNYDLNNPNYLFVNFNGNMSNITFDNFPFVAEYIGNGNFRVNPTFTNVSFNDINVSALNIEEETNLENSVINYGLFSREIIGATFDNLAIQDIHIDNNSVNYSNLSNNNIINMGILAGSMSQTNISQGRITDSNFDNNILKNTFDQAGNLVSDYNIEINLGLIAGNSTDIEIKDFIVNSSYIENNLLFSNQVSLGLLFGKMEAIENNISIENVYFSNSYINQNEINIYDLNANISPAVISGNVLISSDKNVYLTNVLFENLNNSNIVNDINSSGGSKSSQTIEDFISINSHSPNKEEINNTNYIVQNDSSINWSEDYSVVTEDNLTADFWQNTMNFGYVNSPWEFETLLNSDFSISDSKNDDDEIYGYPAFVDMGFVTTYIEDKYDTYLIYVNYVSEYEGNDVYIDSIFGDEYLLEEGFNSFNTEISTDVPLENFETFYWLNLGSNKGLHINGPINTTVSKEYYNLEPVISNDFSLNLIDDQIVYTKNLDVDKDTDADIVFDSLQESSITIKDSLGNQYVLDENNNTIDVPEFVNESNVNDFYKIEVSEENNISYIDTNKEIQTIEPNFDQGDLNNTNTPVGPNMRAPKAIAVNSYYYNKDANFINFEISIYDPYNLVKEDDFTEESSIIKVDSSFQEFEEDEDNNAYSSTVELRDADVTNKGNDLIIDYKLDLGSSVPKDKINDFYAVDNVLELRYYSNYYGDLATMEVNLAHGDLTNTDSSTVNQYDDSSTFQATVESKYNYNSNILEFSLLSDDYQYDLYYNINLTLMDSEGEVDTFTLDSRNNVTHEVKLEDDVRLMVDNNIDINDLFYVSLNEEDSNIVFINKIGNLEADNLRSLSSSTSEGSISNEDVFVQGDLTNVDNKDLVTIGTVAENPTYIAVSILILALIFFITIFAIISYNAGSLRKSQI